MYLSTNEDSKKDRETISQKIQIVNEKLSTECGVLPIELNKADALKVSID